MHMKCREICEDQWKFIAFKLIIMNHIVWSHLQLRNDCQHRGPQHTALITSSMGNRASSACCWFTLGSAFQCRGLVNSLLPFLSIIFSNITEIFTNVNNNKYPVYGQDSLKTETLYLKKLNLGQGNICNIIFMRWSKTQIYVQQAVPARNGPLCT